MKFQPGNTIGTGRPKGSRNKLDAFAFRVILAHVMHRLGDPVPEEFEKNHLWTALTLAMRTNARDYLKSIFSLLPKEVSFEYTNRVGEIDRLIAAFEEQIALADERKLIEHDHTSH